MKISEMTLEQLQDYALQLEQEKTASAETLATKDAEIEELKGFNKDLQRRNMDLFKKVEQAGSAPDDKPADPPKPTETCEDFARRIIQEGVI